MFKNNKIKKRFMSYLIAFAMVFSVFQMPLVNYSIIANALEINQSDFTIEKGVITGYTGTDKDLVIPEKISGQDVIEIGKSAFSKKDITSIQFPKTLKKIGVGAFIKSTVSSVVLNEGLEAIEESAFYGAPIEELVIPGSVKVIGKRAFSGGSKLKNLQICEGVEHIGIMAFQSNILTSVNIPNSVIDIDDAAFSKNKISEVKLGNGLKRIGAQGFEGNNITGLDIPKSLETIYWHSFKDNPGQNNIVNLRFTTPIKLPLGSSKEDAIRKLNEEIKARAYISIGSGENKKNVATDFSSWEISNYDGEKSGQYTAIGNYKSFEDTGVSTDANDELARIRVVANIQVQEEGWSAKDFTFEGTTITGFSDSGKEKFKTNKDLVIPEKNTNGEIIDTIGDKAFNIDSYGEFGIKSLTLPNTLKNIGLMAFRNNNIVELTLPNSIEKLGNGAFSSNKDLETLNLSSSLKVISSGAFSFSKIRDLVIPEGVTEIGGSAFSENKQLSNLNFSSTLEKIGSKSFWGANISELVIPGNVKEIGSDAFLSGKLSSLTLKEGIEKIGNRAFKSNKLKEVIIPNSVTLGSGVFDDNEGIVIKNATEVDDGLWQPKDFTFEGTTVTGFSDSGKEKLKTNKDLVIPDKNTNGDIVKSIGTGAFWSDVQTKEEDKIKSLKLPDTIEVIEARTFGGNLLESLKLPQNIKTIGEGAFESNNIKNMELVEGLVSVGRLSFALNQLTEVTIPTTLREIGQRAFFNNKINKITILPGIEKIGAQCFENNKIQDVDLPDTVREIDLGGFLYNSVKNVKFPKGIKIIGPKAFGVNDIESVTIPDTVELFCPNSFRKNKGFESGEFKIFVDKIVNLSGDFTSEQMKEKLDEEIKVRAAIFKGLIDEDKCILDTESWEKISEEDGYLIFRGKFEPVPVEEIECGSGTSCENTVENMKMTSLIVKVKLDGKLIESEKPTEPEKPGESEKPTNPDKPVEDKEPWEVRHFTITGTTITGFSEVGKEKFNKNKNVIIPEKNINGQVIDSISDAAFNIEKYGEDGIKSIVLPNTIRKIGSIAFRNNNIEHLVLPNSVEELGEGAFAANKDLLTLKLSNKLKSIPKGLCTFTKIENLEIPEGVVEIGDSAFSENKMLAHLTIPSTLKKINSRAFWNAVIVELTIPGNVKEIGSDAFTSGKLSSLTLEEGIEVIGNRAFKRNKLSEVIIPKSVKQLDKSVFERNPSINIKYASLINIIKEAEKVNLQGIDKEKVEKLNNLIIEGKKLNEELEPELNKVNEKVVEIENVMYDILLETSTRPILIKDINKSENGNKIDITISALAKENLKGVVILKVVDDNGKSYKVVCKENSFTSGQNEIKVQLNSSDYKRGIKSFKVYIWDNLDNMTPLSETQNRY